MIVSAGLKSRQPNYFQVQPVSDDARLRPEEEITGAVEKANTHRDHDS